jgi:surface antigen
MRVCDAPVNRGNTGRMARATSALILALLLVIGAAAPTASAHKRLPVKLVSPGGTVAAGTQASVWFKGIKRARCSLQADLAGVHVRGTSVRVRKPLLQFDWTVPANARPGRWALTISCHRGARRGTARTALTVSSGTADGVALFPRRLRPTQAGLTTKGAGSGKGSATWKPFGAVLVPGTDWMGGAGVDVYSNGRIGCVNSCNTMTDFGIAYQCVELVERFLMTKQWSPKIWGDAWQLYDNASEASFDKHKNGSGYIPVAGDVIVWHNGGDGHVAIVEWVANGNIGWVEQNSSASGRSSAPLDANGTLGNYGRLIPTGFLHAKANKPAEAPVQPPLQGSSPNLQGSSPNLQGNNPGSGSAPPPEPPPPAPSPSVSVSKGAGASDKPDCTSQACAYVTVSFANFPDGQHTVTCSASGGDDGGYYTYTRTGTNDTSSVCYYGYPGQTVWVTVDGVRSNDVGW